MKLLTLNCQKGYQPSLKDFLENVLAGETYDVLLLQEATDKVLPFLQHGSYDILRKHISEFNLESDICIVYKKTFVLKNQGFISFAHLREDSMRGPKRSAYGMLWVELEIDGSATRFASTHLHAGITSKARLGGVRLITETLSGLILMPTIIAGDFNIGLSRESREVAGILAPALAWMTEHLGPTLDSRYVENTMHLTNKASVALAFLNIGIRLRTDHVFVSSETAKRNSIACRILPDRVSDHSPVECTIIK